MPRGPQGPGGNVMQQIQKMQAEMLAQQEALADETVEVTVGGGVVAVVMTGHQKLQSVRIQPELLNPSEAEMLSELLIAAVNEAVERSQALAGAKMNAITSQLNLPPGLGI
jgi:DNA-binding YbaB/EbfC family protein